MARLVTLALLTVALLLSSAAASAQGLYLPLVLRPAAPALPSGEAIVIDHTTTDLGLVPVGWIEAAKATLRLSYGHTSHGSQPVSGMTAVEALDPRFALNTNGALEAGVLSLADYTPSGDLGNPDRTTWEARTRAYLATAGANRNVVVWSWCGQAATDDPADIDTYLGLMSGLERDYPGVTFVYMTGHLDGTGPTGALYARNNQIRAHVRQSGGVLFDFADIESYDPGGAYYPNASDACEWCDDWCAAHPGDCAGLPGSCAHSHPLNCMLKGRAFWWMLARLAGWEG